MLDRYDQDLLLDYLEDELDADRRAQLDAMLAEDPQLAALLNEMANDRATLRSMPQAKAPANMVHDVTKTMERQMLLDEPVEDLGPIPLSRGRAATVEPTRSISWGRVVGLTGLAASVALIAGIMVITFKDPLLDTANELAANTPSAEDEATETVVTADEGAILDDLKEGLADLESPAAPAAEALAGGDRHSATDNLEGDAPDLVARGVDTPDWSNPTPGASPEPDDALSPDRALGVTRGTFTVGTTAAISAFQPTEQLVLLSESPETSLEQLFEFCVANGIPVVEPEQLNQNRAFGGADHPNNARSEEEAIGNYALLINESQLDTLVASLNKDIALDPKRVGKGSLISNQAAVITDLPEDDLRYGNYTPDPAPAEEEAADDQQAQIQQARLAQAIELQDPDLGSPYANTRNRYNLKQQQQATYGKRSVPLADLESAEQFADGGASQPQVGAPKPEQARSVAETDETIDLNEEPSPEEIADVPDPQAAPTTVVDRRTTTRTVDPSRGNWLSAHLPVADTTPLLLHWREVQSDEPTRLVPVMVQRAESERVNTLRQRQQFEYGNRLKSAENRSNADSAEAADASGVEADQEAPAGEAEPVEPAEPAR